MSWKNQEIAEESFANQIKSSETMFAKKVYEVIHDEKSSNY